jgi:hypothetical protein
MGYFLLFTRFSTYKNSCINLLILIGPPVALNILLENLVTIIHLKNMCSHNPPIKWLYNNILVVVQYWDYSPLWFQLDNDKALITSVNTIINSTRAISKLILSSKIISYKETWCLRIQTYGMRSAQMHN